MQTGDHLHERIARATTRLAQLQAQELVAVQRKNLREREAARRDEVRRKRRVAELVFATGSETLPDGELVAALLRHREECRDAGFRDEAKRLGDAFLSSIATDATQRIP